MFEVTGFRCDCGAAIDCTYPNCNEGIEMGKKDIIERLQDYAKDYTTTTYHDDLIQEAVTEIESLRQQLAALTMQCEKLVKWKHLMSYNDSYFGEHAGDLKRVVYEIDRSMPIRGDK